MIYKPREDSYLLQEQVKKYAKQKSFLDIGSGSGIQSETAIKEGAKSILATDIQEEVIISLKKKNIPAIRSDLFNKIKGKFDLIAFNPPYLPEDKKEDKKSAITTTGGKKGDEITIRFLKKVKDHLNQNGIILLVLSSLTPQEKIIWLINKLKLKKKKLSQKKIFMEKLEVWEIKVKSS